MEGIVANLRAAGLCAERDPDDGAQETIRIKSENEFSEDYDTLLSSGHMRRGDGAYRQTCNPANFPIDREEDAPPIGSGCGRPYPPPVTRINCKLHIRGPEYYTLDSTPIVGHDAASTARRSATPTAARSALCVRKALRTAKPARPGASARPRTPAAPGPTWRKADGSFCTGPASGCQNHPNTQYSLWTYVPGTYTVSAENGASCSVSH